MVTAATVDAGAPAVRERLLALALAPAWAAVVLTAGAVVVLGPPTTWLQVAVVAAGALLLGLPHGAVDHLTLPRARGEDLTTRDLAAVGGLYAVLGGAYAALWFVAPLVAALGFLALTWLHWGQGDVHPLASLAPGDHPDNRTGLVLMAAVRGGLPMLVPLLAFPDWYRRVLGWFVAPFGGSTAAAAPLFAADTRLALGAGFATLTVIALARGYARAGPSTAWRLDAAETVGLWLFFLAVPPLLAVGVYFSLWHGLRYVVRLLAIDAPSRTALADGRPLKALARFGRDAAPLTAAALALLAVFWLAVPVRPSAPGETAGLALAFVAVLTLPHVVVVWLLDREQGVWTPGALDGAYTENS